MMYQYWIIDLITLTEPNVENEDNNEHMDAFIALLVRRFGPDKWVNLIERQVQHEMGWYHL